MSRQSSDGTAESGHPLLHQILVQEVVLVVDHVGQAHAAGIQVTSGTWCKYIEIKSILLVSRQVLGGCYSAEYDIAPGSMTLYSHKQYKQNTN